LAEKILIEKITFLQNGLGLIFFTAKTAEVGQRGTEKIVALIHAIFLAEKILIEKITFCQNGFRLIFFTAKNAEVGQRDTEKITSLIHTFFWLKRNRSRK
jgi:hypothetical protein